MRFKGTIIQDYVRIIKQYTEKDWNKYLEPEDWEIINNPVLPSAWYPYGPALRMGWAIFQEMGGGDPEAARVYGRANIKKRLEVYKNIVIPGDPVASMAKLAALRKTFVDGETDTLLIENGDDWAKYKVIKPGEDFDPEAYMAFCHQIRGHLEGVVEEAGGKDPSTTIEQKDDGYEITIRWK
jgi:hypothetical protein